MRNETTRKTLDRGTLHASNRKTPKNAALLNICRVAPRTPATSVALEASSKMRLVEASEQTKGEVQTGDKEIKKHSTVADIFSMEIPRRPRSKRSTTVVKLMNFSFRDLPSLLDKKTMSRRQRPSSAQLQQKSEEKDEEKIPRKAPRKPKSDATPQRIVFEQNGTSRERRQRRRRPSCGLPSETEFTDDMRDDANRSRFVNKRARVNTIHTRGRAKIERERISKKTKQDDSHKKRSLRSVIDRCQKEEKSRTTTTTATTSVEKEPPPPTELVNETISSPTPPPESDVVDPSPSPSLSPPPTPEETAPEDDIHPDCCPTVADLLQKGLVRVGDYVNLNSANSDLMIEGWITCRGKDRAIEPRGR